MTPNVVTTVLTATVIGLIDIFIIASNVIVISVYVRHTKLSKQRANWFLVSLAVADLSVGIAIIPVSTMVQVLGHWPLSGQACEIWLASDVFFSTASMVNICMIGLDRLFAIKSPTRYAHRRPFKTVAAMIVAGWAFSLAIALPPLIGWQPAHNPEQCRPSSEDIGYVLYSSLGSFFIPMGLLIVVYVHIYIMTKRRSRMMRSKIWTHRRLIADIRRNSTQQANLTVVDATNTKRKTVPRLVSNCSLLVGVAAFKMRQSNTQSSSVNEPTESCASFFENLDAEERDRSGTDTQPFRKVSAERNRSCPTITELNQEATTENKVTRWQPAPQLIITEAENDSQPSTRSSISTNVSSATPLRAVIRRPTLLNSKSDTNITTTTLSTATACLFIPGQEISARFTNRLKNLQNRERKSALLLGSIICAFTLCWLPFFSVYLLRGLHVKIADELFDTFFFLGYCNSGLNPLIYALFSRDFRTAIKKDIFRR